MMVYLITCKAPVTGIIPAVSPKQLLSSEKVQTGKLQATNANCAKEVTVGQPLTSKRMDNTSSRIKPVVAFILGAGLGIAGAVSSSIPLMTVGGIFAGAAVIYMIGHAVFNFVNTPAIQDESISKKEILQQKQLTPPSITLSKEKVDEEVICPEARASLKINSDYASEFSGRTLPKVDTSSNPKQNSPYQVFGQTYFIKA